MGPLTDDPQRPTHPRTLSGLPQQHLPRPGQRPPTFLDQSSSSSPTATSTLRPCSAHCHPPPPTDMSNQQLRLRNLRHRIPTGRQILDQHLPTISPNVYRPTHQTTNINAAPGQSTHCNSTPVPTPYLASSTLQSPSTHPTRLLLPNHQRCMCMPHSNPFQTNHH